MEERLIEGPRFQSKQNKHNARERPHGICKQTKKRPEDTSPRQLWLTDYDGKQTSMNTLALSIFLLDHVAIVIEHPQRLLSDSFSTVSYSGEA